MSWNSDTIKNTNIINLVPKTTNKIIIRILNSFFIKRQETNMHFLKYLIEFLYSKID